MATCTPSAVVAAAKCFPCLTRKQLAATTVAGLLNSGTRIIGGGVPCVAPSAPTRVGVIGVTNTTIRIGWKAGKNTGSFITGWQVSWGTVSGGPYPNNSGTLPPVPASYTITGLTAGTTYFIVVQAVAFAGCLSSNSTEVSATTTGIAPPPPNGLLNSLVYYFNMDVLSGGTTVTDNVVGQQLIGLNGGADSSLVSGILNNSVQYTGAAGLNGMYATAPSNVNWIPDTGVSQTYQIWFWVDVGQPQATPGIFSFWEAAGASQYGYFYITAASGIVHWVWENAASAQISLDAAAGVTTGAWHHFVGGYDALNARLFMYLDGGAIQTTAMASVKPFTNGFAIGLFNLRATSNELKGRVDEFAVWHNRVLNATDVANLYNNGHALPYSSFTN